MNLFPQHHSFRRSLGAPTLLLIAFMILLPGCSGKTVTVEIPPKVDLRTWPVIGVISFTADDHDDLAQPATQKFLIHLQGAQPGTRLLELGRKEDVLQAINRNALDPDAIKAIGSRYGVAAVLVGELDVAEMKPDIHFSPDLKSVSAKASVEGSLSAKLQETSTGATVWTNGAHGKWPVAKMNLGSAGLSDIGISAPGDRYGQMLRDLTKVATHDFRRRYEKRRVQD